MSLKRQIADLLKSSGMALERHKKHLIYRHPDGRSFALSGTPSDFRAENNQLRDLKNFLGLTNRGPSKETPRVKTSAPQKRKRERQAEEFTGHGTAGCLLASQLQSAFANHPAMQRAL